MQSNGIIQRSRNEYLYEIPITGGTYTTEPALDELREEAARLNQEFLDTLKQLSKQQHEVLQKMAALEEFRAML